MTSNKILSYLILCSLLFTTACEAAQKKLRVIALTDLHGALDPQEDALKDGTIIRIGGAVYLASYIKQLQKTDVPTVIIDAGDLFQGSLVSNTVEGRPVVDFYNAIGMDAVAIGNHEFDYGPEGEQVIPKTPADDPRGALKKRINQAKFPFLAVNIRNQKGETPSWTKPSILLERSGVKIGIIGAATVSTPTTTISKNVADLAFIDPVAPVIAEAKKLRDQGADYVILAAHAGGGCRDNSEQKHDDLSSCDKASEMFDILKQIPPGTLDLVVAGHTHKGVSKVVNGTPMLQSFSNGKYIAWADFGNGSETKLSEPIPVCSLSVNTSRGPTCDAYNLKNATGPAVKSQFQGITVEADAQIAALLKPDFDRVEVIKNAPVGVSSEDEFTRSYYDENALGNLFSDVYRKYFAGDVDLTVMNNGGLRANIKPGALKYVDIFNILPFDNRLAILNVSGATILNILKTGISRVHGGLSYSDELRFTADGCNVLTASINGAPIEPTKIYRVLTVDFLAMGGSGFANVGIQPDQVKVLEDLPVIRDVMVDALKKVQPTLRSSLYFNSHAPRQDLKKICEENSGAH